MKPTPRPENIEALARLIADCAALLQNPGLSLNDVLMYSILLTKNLQRLKEYACD